MMRGKGVEDMVYCRNCGAQIHETAVKCPKCGAEQQAALVYQATPVNQAMPVSQAVPVKKDSGSFGWLVLGFLVPVMGLLLFLLWHDSEPKNARMAGLGALISTILSVVAVLVYVLFVFVMVGAMIAMI